MPLWEEEDFQGQKRGLPGLQHPHPMGRKWEKKGVSPPVQPAVRDQQKYASSRLSSLLRKFVQTPFDVWRLGTMSHGAGGS